MVCRWRVGSNLPNLLELIIRRFLKTSDVGDNEVSVFAYYWSTSIWSVCTDDGSVDHNVLIFLLTEAFGTATGCTSKEA